MAFSTFPSSQQEFSGLSRDELGSRLERGMAARSAASPPVTASSSSTSPKFLRSPFFASLKQSISRSPAEPSQGHFVEAALPSPPDTISSDRHVYSKTTDRGMAGYDGNDDEVDCPVCLEPLSLRLRGEKPHVVPICGHKLHDSCFEAVYGGISRARSRTGTSLGLCGVCRRDMRLGDGESSGKSKFAALSGLPSREPLDSHKMKSISKRTLHTDGISAALHDPADDDDLSRDPMPPVEAIQPVISVRTEHAMTPRPGDREGKTFITSLVTVELPSRSGIELEITPRQHMRRTSDGTSTTSMTSRARADTATPKQHDDDLAPEAVVRDLCDRMSDWKGHTPDDFGRLRLYDYLNVAKDSSAREFLVYLFEEALLCVAEDTPGPKSAAALKERIAGSGSIRSGSSATSSADRLRLKGRVFVRHIRKVEELPAPEVGEHSLTITMGDESLQGFVVGYKTRESLELWKAQFEQLIVRAKTPRARDSTMSSVNSDSGNSAYTRATRTTAISSVPSKGIPEDDVYSPGSDAFPSPPSTAPSRDRQTSVINVPAARVPFVSSNELTPIDLVLMLSIPSSSSSRQPSSASLKRRLVADTVSYIAENAGPRARIAVVAYTAGHARPGALRKTALIAVGTEDGAERMRSAIDDLVADQPSQESALRWVDNKEDKINVVSAVNLALDIVLQRHHKAPITGLVLLNDGRDGAAKTQMDLCMARAEAAAVPIHTFGWGKAHDPSSLWLLSQHTGGTYTFIKDWYGVRDAIAGCVGSLLAIGLRSLRLHLSVPEKRWFRIRKVAGVGSTAVVSADGADADIELGELRFGERREMLVEVEMGSLPAEFGNAPSSSRNSSSHPKGNGRQRTSMTGTDAFFMEKAGLDPRALAATGEEDEGQGTSSDDSADADEEALLADDVPLFEVNTSYRDPRAGKSISRLPQPVLLTIAIGRPQHDDEQAPPSHPDVVRRRIELLCSDMMTRCLLLMSRRNAPQALRLMAETRRIISTIAGNLPTMTRGMPSLPATHAMAILNTCTEDVDQLVEAIRLFTEASATTNGENAPPAQLPPGAFDATHRNYAAQQAIVLRDQHAWTARTGLERAYFRADLGIFMARRSADFPGSS